MSGSSVVSAPDGRVLRASGSPDGFMGPWAFVVWLHGPSGALRLSTGAVGSFELTERQVGRLGRLRVASAQAGSARVRAFTDPEAGGTHFVWGGAYHEVSTYVQATGVPLDRFVRLLRTLDIRDSADGVRLIPKRASGAKLTSLAAVNSVPLTCTVTARPHEQAAAMVPAWAGRQVAGGQLWRYDEAAGGHTRRVGLIANPTVVTVLAAGGDGEPRLAGLAQTLSLSFSTE
jgi:hypothetical protein